jgi:gliding motility-associated protein GldE
LEPSGQLSVIAIIPYLLIYGIPAGIPVWIFISALLGSVGITALASVIYFRKHTKISLPNNIRNELSEALDMHSDSLIEEEKIFKGILNFGNTSVSAIMCPRMDVTAVDNKWGFKRILDVIVKSGFSRIPVYSGSFDAIKGILYTKDIVPYASNPGNFRWQSLVRPPYFVPETKKISDLLKEFQNRKIHMAIVIDEFGGISGIVTLEDILEEIVGEIADESDEETQQYRIIGENSFVFEGKTMLNDFCRIIGIDEDTFEDDRGESETLAGLVLELTGEIPQKDQVINYRNFIFRIESADRRRIKEIGVEIIKDENAANTR